MEFLWELLLKLQLELLLKSLWELLLELLLKLLNDSKPGVLHEKKLADASALGKEQYQDRDDRGHDQEHAHEPCFFSYFYLR